MLNILQNIFVGQLVNTSQGPVITTQVYDIKALTYLDVYEWEVYNGARLVEPLPFGMFGEIQKINMNKSRLQLRLAPGFLDTPTAPLFQTLVEKDTNYGKYMANAVISRKVVPPDFNFGGLNRTDFWDFTLEPIDSSHSLLTQIHTDTPQVRGTETNRDLYAALPYTEEIVTAQEADAEMAAGYNPNVTFTPVDVFHTLRRESVIPVNALNAFVLRFPTKFNLSLPPVLKSLGVVWNTQSSIGTQDTQALDHADGTSGSVSLSVPDSASSAAAVTAELNVVFEDYATANLYTETLIFYMPPPVTQATIIAKVNSIYGLNSGTTPTTVAFWPVFKPRSESIILTGQSINVRANVQVALHNAWSASSNSYGWTKSVSDDFAVGITNNVVQLPACIHGTIAITDSADHIIPVSATAFMGLSSSNGASVTATKTKSGTAYGRITPTALTPTGGTNAVPTGGLYIMDVDVAPYDFGWFKVRVEVFNASVLL